MARSEAVAASMGGRRRWRRAPAVVGLLALISAPAVAVAAPAATVAQPLAVAAARPVLPAHSLAVGPVAGAVSGEVALAPRDPAALADYAREVVTPSSPLYHHELAKGAFGAVFGPLPSAVDAVASTLRRAGLEVGPLSADGLLLPFHGSAERVGAAFHTSLERYRLPGGRVATATTSAARLPGPVAASVTAVTGIDTLLVPHAGALQLHRRMAPTPRAPTASAHGGPKACAAATATTARLGGYTETGLADAYGLGGLYQRGADGAGETIAVYELEPFGSSALNTFDTCYFGATQARAMLGRLHVVPVDGGVPTGVGSGEAALDVEIVSALAPGATIDVYEAPQSGNGYLDAFNQIVQADPAVVSSSWGSGCETQVAAEQPGLEQAENVLFEAAAAQGETVFDASGDVGSDDCAYGTTSPVAPDLSVTDPSSQPYVVSVGGTALLAPSPHREQVWNNGINGAGGGGVSALWPAPAWQDTGKVPGFDATKVVARAEAEDGGALCQGATPVAGGVPCREIPDVSAEADPYYGLTIDYLGGWTEFGGTSISTPEWAAALADIDSTPSCQAVHGTGFVSPLLYQVASVPSEYRASFFDVTESNNDSFGASGGLYPATTGFDMASGLGTPRVTGSDGADGLAYYLCRAAAATAPTVTAVAPAVVADDSPETVTVTGTGFESAGAPDVAGVTIGTFDVPAADVTVGSATSLTVDLPAQAVQAGAMGPTQPGGDAGTFDVTVTLTGGATSAPTSSGRLTVYDPAPSPTASSVPVVGIVSPTGGPDAGGTRITIYGSGFDATGAATSVTFGGVPGTDLDVVSDNELTVDTPAYGSGSTACLAGDQPVVDACQSQVVVTAGGQASAESTILPEYSGGTSPAAAPADSTATPVSATPAPASTEMLPAATEFDYLPPPTVTSVDFDGAPPYASNEGGTTVTVHGTGLGILGLEWFDIGKPGSVAHTDAGFESVSATSVQLILPGAPHAPAPTSFPLAAQTLASPTQGDVTSSEEPSPTVPVSYAPQPTVTSISTPDHLDAGSVRGGTRITVKGSGFDDGPFVVFEDTSGGPSFGTAYALTRSPTDPNGELSFTTPVEGPGIDDVLVCNGSECSAPSAGGVFTFFEPFYPHLRSLGTHSAKPGALLEIRGINLAFVRAVYFGPVRTTTAFNPVNSTNGETSPSTVYVTVPRGPAGRTVNVRVVTVASLRRPYPKSPVNAAARFTFPSQGRARVERRRP